MKLSVPLSLPIGQNLVAPICLPSPGGYPHSRVVAIGWGDTQVSVTQLQVIDQ